MNLMRVEIANDVEVCRSPPNRRGLTTCSYLLPVISMPSIQRLAIFSGPLAGKQSDGGIGFEPKSHDRSPRLRCNWQDSNVQRYYPTRRVRASRTRRRSRKRWDRPRIVSCQQPRHEMRRNCLGRRQQAGGCQIYYRTINSRIYRCTGQLIHQNMCEINDG